MSSLLGLGLTHYPGLFFRDEDMSFFLRRTMTGRKFPDDLRDPAAWPAGMRDEWGNDQGAASGRVHRERCLRACRAIRDRLDAFRPDAVVIFGDDQYENFTEDIVPPFCAFITEEHVSRPFDSGGHLPMENIWSEAPATEFRHAGHPDVGRFIANGLFEDGVAVPYAYRLRFGRGLAHAFINTLLLLDVDRRGFPYPVVPFHVNCYGGSFLRARGGRVPPSDVERMPDPPSPSPAACFDMGAAVARVLARSPWRVALVASSSWSHAFLTAKSRWLYPDHDSDRARLAELRNADFAAWRRLPLTSLVDAGQHEMLNWVTLAGAMHEAGHRTEIVDWVETWVMNSNKCFAVFPPGRAETEQST